MEKIIIIYEKSHFQYRAKEHPAVTVAAGAKNASTVNAWHVRTFLIHICIEYNIQTGFLICICVRSCRMYNSYQIHFAVVVVICRKFIRIWFDEQTR